MDSPRPWSLRSIARRGDAVVPLRVDDHTIRGDGLVASNKLRSAPTASRLIVPENSQAAQARRANTLSTGVWNRWFVLLLRVFTEIARMLSRMCRSV